MVIRYTWKGVMLVLGGLGHVLASLSQLGRPAKGITNPRFLLGPGDESE